MRTECRSGGRPLSIKISEAGCTSAPCRRTVSVCTFNPDSEIGTADSTDFTDFEEVIGDGRMNLFMAKLQGDAN